MESHAQEARNLVGSPRLLRYTRFVNRSGMNSLSEVLNAALKRLDLADAALEARAVMLWPQIVGEQMARASEAQRVQAGTLLITTRSSVWSQEFSFQKPAILRRFKERLGKDFVKDLRFTVGPVRGVASAPGIATPSEQEVRRIRLPREEVERISRAAANGDPELAQAVRQALTHEAQLRAWQLQHGARECPRCGAAYRSNHPLCPPCRREAAEL
jgi:predicted nucleic acid-binding Zn ribbon protein